MKDILKLLRGFETLNDYFNRDKVIKGILEIVQESSIYEDSGFLEVLNECHTRGLLTENQDLYVKSRVYFQERFPYMDRADILGYLELFWELGLLFEDEEIAHLLRAHL